MDYYLPPFPRLFVVLRGFIISKTMIEAKRRKSQININKSMLCWHSVAVFILNSNFLWNPFQDSSTRSQEIDVTKHVSLSIQHNATCFILIMFFSLHSFLNRSVIVKGCDCGLFERKLCGLEYSWRCIMR